MEPHRILIVDKNPSVRETLSDILSAKGYVAATAATGNEALDRLDTEPPDVALIDLKLTDMSGVELVRKIKERSPVTECIVLSGYDSKAAAIQAVSLGAYGYMLKTCDSEELLGTIRRALGQAEEDKTRSELAGGEGGQRILIVDDNPSVTTTLADILGAKGYVPATAATGREAVESVEQEPPAVAIIDLRLDDMSGVEVVAQIKSRSPDTECILLTGYASLESAIEAVNQGAFGYMLKTVDLEQLLVTIRRAIEKVEADRRLRESEERYRQLFSNSLNGIAFHEIVTDAEGRPVDYIFLEVNRAFEELTGLRASDIIGRRVTRVIPETKGRPLIRLYGRAALTGEPIRFEQYLPSLDRHYEIAVFSPRKGQFATILTDITARVRAQRALQDQDDWPSEGTAG